jgi:hypothetical protein
MSCRKIRKLIDEAERPDLLMPEAASHLESCPACNEFARQRASLRKLLISSGRVSAPPDFQIRLKQRLEELSLNQSPPILMRLWKLAAAAAIIIAVATFLLRRGPQPEPTPSASTASPVAQIQPIQSDQKIPALGRNRPAKHKARPAAARPEGLDAMPRAALILVRQEDVEYELAIPAVSVGAQPIVYDLSSKGSARVIKTSF